MRRSLLFAVLVACGALAAALPAATPAKERPACAGKRATVLVDASTRHARGLRHVDNVIVGTAKPERLSGADGDDRLCGRGGGDVLRGGRGRDRLHAAVGADRLFGNHGNDRAIGWRGRDRVFGGPGNDRLLGGPGRDRLHAGPGRDRLHAGRGRDRVHAGSGRDRVLGGPGPDRIKVSDGERDRLNAGRGADTVFARDGAPDAVNCGPGNDTAYIDDLDTVTSCETQTLDSDFPAFTLPSWSDAGWSDPSNYATIQTGDLDGDGDADLFGRNSVGIEAHRFDQTTGQWLPLPMVPGVSDAGGWAAEQYYDTIQPADLDGDGADEIVARFAGGLEAWQLDVQAGTWRGLPALTGDLTDGGGWWLPQYYKTIHAADLDGDGADEIFARDAEEIVAWRFEDGEWQGLPALPGFSDAIWDQEGRYTTLQAADLDGNGSEEIFGRNGTAIVVWQFIDGAWQELPPLANPALDPPDDPGWNFPQYYSTIQAANLDGKPGDEIFARDTEGIIGWAFDPQSGTWRNIPPIDGLCDSPCGWDQAQYYSTIQSGDLDGDGADEIVARAGDGIHAWSLSGNAWTPLPTQGDFSDDRGWSRGRYYPSIQTANVDGGKRDELLARGLTGVVTYGYQGGSWTGLSPQYPEFVGESATAYAAINAYIGGEEQPSFDLRKAYAGAQADSTDIDGWRDDVNSAPKPAGVSDDVWAEVKNELLGDLAKARLVADWYGSYLTEFTDQLYGTDALDGSQAVFEAYVEADEELKMEEWEVIEGLLEGLNIVDAVDGDVGEAAGVVNALLGGGFTAGFGVEGVDGALAGIEATYSVLRGKLQQDFQLAQDGNRDAQSEIMSDYGLLSAVSGLINSGTWQQLGDDEGAAIASASRNYTVGMWQAYLPEVAMAFSFPPNPDGGGCPPSSLWGTFCDWDNGDRTLYWELGWYDRSSCGGSNANGPCEQAPQGLRQQLFGQPSQECQTAWDWQACNLGVPYSELFFGQSGWSNLASWSCSPKQALTDQLGCSRQN